MKKMNVKSWLLLVSEHQEQIVDRESINGILVKDQSDSQQQNFYWQELCHAYQVLVEEKATTIRIAPRRTQETAPRLPQEEFYSCTWIFERTWGFGS